MTNTNEQDKNIKILFELDEETQNNINSLKDDIKTLKDEIEELKEEHDEKEEGNDKTNYDDMLDDCYPVVKIGSLEYSPSHVLKNIDEIAYNCGYNDYIDEELTRIDEDIENKEQEIKDKEEEIKEIIDNYKNGNNN